MFYAYVVCAYILNARIGFNLSWTVSYIAAGVFAAAYACGIVMYGKKQAALTSAE